MNDDDFMLRIQISEAACRLEAAALELASLVKTQTSDPVLHGLADVVVVEAQAKRKLRRRLAVEVSG